MAVIGKTYEERRYYPLPSKPVYDAVVAVARSNRNRIRSATEELLVVEIFHAYYFVLVGAKCLGGHHSGRRREPRADLVPGTSAALRCTETELPKGRKQALDATGA